MVFTCSASSSWSREDIDRLVRDFPCLKDYDIRLSENKNLAGFSYRVVEITINSLEDLVELSKKVDQPLVFDGRDPYIEIYDTWRE